MAKAAVFILLGCSFVVACGGGGPPTTPGSSAQPSVPFAATHQPRSSSALGQTPGVSVASPSGGGVAAAGTWTAGQGQAGAGSTLLDCATSTLCIAGGYVWNGSSWSPMSAPDTGPPSILDCRTATDCSAISDDQYTAWNGSAWRRPRTSTRTVASRVA
jgi:hypothetical protein